ncbi:hypothetical protein [Metabacillus sediminilitoris]|uniref:YHYH domain-containing protein n=1 Tax=Metabacillus sediminilitoris TaxID=2567941 RepID=A0A4S4C082_9BACI|nr:hypothetical protein [Metabacillus sediminilitoris]QGQ44760.1 hypothetical protein GMB29_05430 [Metabacillus sediminilitoris]THF78892.1 hypothetical protein E6W99_14280 [Metabacillus sediminilitoris]
MKRNFIVLATSILLIFICQEVKAHPGNTDSFGKHTCRTNCEKWGLEYGEYHGHGGADSSSSSGSSGTSSDSNYSNDVPVMTEEELEVHYEELQNEGYDIGYQNGYNGEVFVDFHEEKYAELSNADYSWYEAGYEAGYTEGEAKKAAEIQKQQEEDYQAGEKIGFQQGKIDFENKVVQQNPQTNSSQTEYWNKGFAAGYKKVIQVMQQTEKAKEEGHQQGLTHEDINIPSKYASEDETKQAFEEGFKKGEDERIKHLQETYEKEGYEAGYNQQTFTIPKDVPELYKISFKQGFENGYNAKEDEAYQRGYDLAFTTTKYKADDQYKEYSNLQKQHKNGFDSNEEDEELREEAFEAGKSAEELSIPVKFKNNNNAVNLYNKYYKKGKEEREERNKQILIGGLVLVPTGIVGGFYLHRRKSKQ